MSFFKKIKKQTLLCLKAENNYQIDYNELKSLVNKNTKGIILNYPTNPTGAVFTDESLQNVCKVAKENDLINADTYIPKKNKPSPKNQKYLSFVASLKAVPKTAFLVY